MSKKSKALAKLANFNADNTWTFDEAVWLLLAHGYALRGREGSHRAFTAPGKERPLVLVQHGKKLKSGYVRLMRQEILNQ